MPYDIEMTTDDTLELDAIIKEWSSPSSAITVNPQGSLSSDSHSLNGFETKTGVFDPDKAGEYEIKINGQILSINVTDDSAIPDTSMFDSPIYQFYAGSSSSNDFTEVLDDQVSDASGQNSPSLTQDYENAGYDMFDYVDSSNQYHTVSPDSEYSSDNKLSVFALCYPKSIVDFANAIFSPNENRELNFNDSSYSIGGGSGYTTYDAGTVTADTLDTIGFSWDAGGFGDGDVFKLFGGGSEVKGVSSFDMGDLNNTPVEIGANSTRGVYFNGGIAEVIICSGPESKSNYSTYHNDRV